MRLPPTTLNAVNIIEDLINHIQLERAYLVSEDDVAAWEKIKYDLRRLQEIDKRHDGSW